MIQSSEGESESELSHSSSRSRSHGRFMLNRKKIKKRLGSYKSKVKIVVIVEPIMILFLIAFWVALNIPNENETFSTASVYSKNETDHIKLEGIRDNHRASSYKKSKKLKQFFYVFTVFTAILNLFGNALLAFDTKNRMAACLLWLFIHGWWMLICIIQIVRGIFNRVQLSQMNVEIKKEEMWENTTTQLIFVTIYYSMFLAVDIIFSQIVRNRFLYLRKAAKSAQHIAGKRFIQTLKKKKIIRIKQKELYDEREETKKSD